MKKIKGYNICFQLILYNSTPYILLYVINSLHFDLNRIAYMHI